MIASLQVHAQKPFSLDAFFPKSPDPEKRIEALNLMGIPEKWAKKQSIGTFAVRDRRKLLSFGSRCRNGIAIVP